MSRSLQDPDKAHTSNLQHHLQVSCSILQRCRKTKSCQDLHRIRHWYNQKWI